MLEIYHGHFAGHDTTSLPQAASHGNQDDSDQQQPVIVFGQRHIHTGTADLAGQPRAAADQLNQRFARLANPTLILYVFPHLGANNQYPIPGYSTAFSLYEQVYYALPGETVRQPLSLLTSLGLIRNKELVDPRQLKRRETDKAPTERRIRRQYERPPLIHQSVCPGLSMMLKARHFSWMTASVSRHSLPCIQLVPKPEPPRILKPCGIASRPC